MIAFLLLNSCDEKSNSTDNKKVIVMKEIDSLFTDTSVYAIIPFDTTLTWLFPECKQSSLNEAELIQIDLLLNKCIDEYNVGKEKRYNQAVSNSGSNLTKDNFVIDLNKRKRQYVVVTNSNNEKIVWINCFCGNWDISTKTSILSIKDGGNCLFNLKINLSKKIYFELSVNGDA